MNKICLELKMMNLEVTKKILTQNGHYKIPHKLEIFNLDTDTDIVIVEFINSSIIDQSALQVIEDLAVKYKKRKKHLQLRHLSTDCHSLLRKAGQLIVDADDDPSYGVAVDYGVKPGAFGKTH